MIFVIGNIFVYITVLLKTTNYKIMKKFILFLLCALPAITLSAQSTYPVKRNVEITSSAKRTVEPDKFYVRVLINDNNGAGRKGIEQTENNVFIPTLKKEGIDVKTQLTISDYSSYYEGKSKIITTKSYQLILTSAKQLNSVMSALQNAGISNTNVTRAVYTKSTQVVDSLKKEAIVRAKKNADIIAEATGDKVGKVLYVRFYDQNYDTDYFRPMSMGLKGAVADSNSESSYQPISFRTIDLSVQMTVVYALED